MFSKVKETIKKHHEIIPVIVISGVAGFLTSASIVYARQANRDLNSIINTMGNSSDGDLFTVAKNNQPTQPFAIISKRTLPQAA